MERKLRRSRNGTVLKAILFLPVMLLNVALITGSGIKPATAETVLTALVYDFPPYYEEYAEGHYRGIGIDFLNVMSELDADYDFIPVGTSPRRRHSFFFDRKIDLSIFDQIDWGWPVDKVDVTQVYMGGGERYIASKKLTTDQKIFNKVTEYRLASILGYHYRFSKYQADPAVLHGLYDIELVRTQDQIIKMVLGQRVDIGVVTEAYLFSYLKQHQAAKDELLISDIYDQVYGFVGIRNHESQISQTRLANLLSRTYSSEKFQKILEEYGH